MVKLHGQCNAPGEVMVQRENAEEDEAKSQMKNIRLGVGESA